ncbi:MAG TPA: class I SAM-dependent methyltransferase [Kribbellaceae bacterium]|nr:class I SAM-dependent methyltransferase [Kribbellaceae bacterium]
MGEQIAAIGPELHTYMVEHSNRLDDVAERLRAETERLGGVSEMLTSPSQSALLTILTRISGARSAVEIGTFTGFSALAIARGLPDDGRLVCLDSSEEWTTIARKYWAEAGVGEKIDLRIGDAHESVRALPEGETIDLAFVDADKSGYVDYYEQLLARLRPNGILLADNTLADGRVVGEHEREPAVKEFNDHVAGDDRVDVVLLPIGDGLTLIRKR